MVLGHESEGEERGIGSRRTISMSKTRKIIARRKKRREKGRRALFLGSNPHSKGVNFSRLGGERRERREVRPRMARGKAEARRKERRGESMGCCSK